MADDDDDTVIRHGPLDDKPSFDRLPDDIIEQILTVADANAFASLVFLNRKWHSVSQRSHLYLHQLRQCSSAPPDPSPPRPEADQLPRLRRLFARQVKRNLFDAYLRPRKTVIKLVSTSISPSSCPVGEGMQFSASPRAQLMLAYNSSRIHVLDVRGGGVQVKREFKIRRRPVAVCIKDDASLLAILSSEMQVDIHDLTTSPPTRKQSIVLDNAPRTIALSPCGSVLAAAYEAGIEVSSLNPGALPSEKRSVKCDPVDSLAFSYDGTQILGTTTYSSPPSTVVLTAPYYDPENLSAGDNIGSMWTTSILFPNSSRDCSHAVLLQDGSQDEASWTFAYDRSFETFRAVCVDDLRNGTTYFTGPVPEPAPQTAPQAKMLPSTLSGANYAGDLVAAGFHGKEIWLYGIPEDLDAVPDTGQLAPDKRSSTHSALGQHGGEPSGGSRDSSSAGRDADGGQCVPQWQLLCDRLRNTLLPGSMIAELAGVSTVRWVAHFGDSPLKERLVVTATGVNGPRLVTDEEGFDFVDGGRIALLDFDYSLENGGETEMAIEVGTDEAETLEEERRDMETEVAIVRRRTVARSRGGGSALLRAAASVQDLNEPVPALPGVAVEDEDEDGPPVLPTRDGKSAAIMTIPAPIGLDDVPDQVTMEEQEAMDAPYTHASPRSAPTLRRAATAAAMSQRQRQSRLAGGRPIEYNRADGRREHPHESDADNWEPPPPPYQKEDPGDLPAFLRGPAVAPLGLLPIQPSTSPPVVGGGPTAGASDDLAPPATDRPPYRRAASDSATATQAQPQEPSSPRPIPSEAADADELYDASPRQSLDEAGGGVEAPPQEEAQASSLPRAATPQDAVPSPTSRVATPRDPAPPSSASSDGMLCSEPAAVALSSVQPEPSIPASQTMSQDTLDPVGTQGQPGARRLSDPPAWPLAPVPDNVDHPTMLPQDVPRPAPVADRPIDESLPPAPSSSQIASLNKRVSRGNPNRLSGSYRGSSLFSGGHGWIPPSKRPARTQSGSLWNFDAEQPLIISTPKGVEGSFDSLPGKSKPAAADKTATETPLVAPVPRHPIRGHVLDPESSGERLETIYSNTVPQQPDHQQPDQEQPDQEQPDPQQPVPPRLSRGARNRNSIMAGGRTARKFLKLWRQPSTSSTGAVRLSRKPSRASRSAARNVEKARNRGWVPRTAKTRPSLSRGRMRDDGDGNGDGSMAADTGMSNSIQWMSVSAPEEHEDPTLKKCTVM
ncbi:FBOX protein [Geosmithia morbida]|uniref:FBOX protein n=1 Tax=Geosmithia morbida TaxID=1094350 RepID=A0A9P5D4E4_9HYPO|nr:FBOX protein [Geosmithia morbida]KAF4123451.1 FBOX protein [Geosmithia morbida]